MISPSARTRRWRDFRLSISTPQSFHHLDSDIRKGMSKKGLSTYAKSGVDIDAVTDR